MLKKIYEFQKLNNYMLSMESRGGRNMALRIFLLFAITISMPLISIGIGMKTSFWLLLFIIVMWMGYMQMTNIRNTLIRNLPVSDKFLVANCMFINWIQYYVMVFGVLLIMQLAGSLLYILTDTKSSSAMNSSISLIYDIGFINFDSGLSIIAIVFCLLVMLTIWFCFCIAMFTRNKIARAIIMIGIAVIYLAFIYSVKRGAVNKGFYGSVKLTDALQVYSVYPVMIIALVAAVIMGIVCWKYCLKKLRYDVKGQETSYINETKSINEYNKFVQQTVGNRGDMNGKRTVALIVVAVMVFAVVISMQKFGIIGSSDDAKEIDIRTSSVADYDKWEDKEGNYIFPESVNESEVSEYKAAKYGAIDTAAEWESLVKYRYLCQRLSDDEYEAEKERVAAITVTNNSKYASKHENHMIHDTKHFPKEAYIAIYQPTLQEYEYALFDDEKKEITYVYCSGEEYRKVLKDYDIFAKGSVISIEQANTDDMEYSIESFYDTSIGWYDTISE